MNEQKNKQQPKQGNENNQDKSRQQSDGQQSGNQMRGGQQSDGKQMPPKGNMADARREEPIGSDIENPDREIDPGKKINIDDDPDQTKKKVPNIGK